MFIVPEGVSHRVITAPANDKGTATLGIKAVRQRFKNKATTKITKAMELIAASQIPRSQARIAANKGYREGMRRIIVEAALGDPAGAARAILAAVDAERPPLRLVLGRYAVDKARRRLTAAGRELDAWAEVGAAADFATGG